MNMTPAEVRQYNNAHRPRSYDLEVRGSAPARRAVKDPFEHVSHPENYLVPGAPASGKTIPRHRWPENPANPGLEPSSTDANRYESFKRDQALGIAMAVEAAEKAHRNRNEHLHELASVNPALADSASDPSRPSSFPPQTAAEEAERAEQCRKRLHSLDLGYEMFVQATGTFMKDTGGGPVNEFAYVIVRVSGQMQSQQYVGGLVGAEGFAWTAWRDEQRKAEALKRLAENTKPLIKVGEVICVPWNEDFPSEQELEMRRIKAEVKAELMAEMGQQAS